MFSIDDNMTAIFVVLLLICCVMANDDITYVRFDVLKLKGGRSGSFVARVEPDKAPLGAARFLDLVRAGFYDDARIFRTVKNFVVQFGLAADPQVTRRWQNPIRDDPVKGKNIRGTMTFATSGPDTRTTQLFINLGQNTFLDSQGFSPFATVVKGMSVVDEINFQYGEQAQQHQITSFGNSYLEREFPEMSFITRAKIISAHEAGVE
jgi:peptidyl-prolyl cis-trans isomerase A (cyclophilin A)